MSTSAKRVTADELIRMPEDRGPFELIEGELHPLMSPRGAAHGVVSATITRILRPHATALGVVMTSEVGFLLARDPDTVLAPDVSFVRSERLTGGIPDAYFEGPPDLAASLVWIVDHQRRVVEVFSAQHDGHSFSADETLDAEPVLPGFRCQVRESFTNLDRHEA